MKAEWNFLQLVTVVSVDDYATSQSFELDYVGIVFTKEGTLCWGVYHVY